MEGVHSAVEQRPCDCVLLQHLNGTEKARVFFSEENSDYEQRRNKDSATFGAEICAPRENGGLTRQFVSACCSTASLVRCGTDRTEF